LKKEFPRIDLKISATSENGATLERVHGTGIYNLNEEKKKKIIGDDYFYFYFFPNERIKE